MLSRTRSVTINEYKVDVNEGEFKLNLAQTRTIIGFAPKQAPSRKPELGITSRATAILLVEESTGDSQQEITFKFVKSGAPLELEEFEVYLGSVWQEREETLYHLIGQSKTERRGGAC